jgi:Flavin containing amine oxidoreductase
MVLDLYGWVDPPVVMQPCAHTCMQAETDEDAATAAAAMAVLRQVHGPSIPEPTAVHVSRWGLDPYSRGGSGCWDRLLPYCCAVS